MAFDDSNVYVSYSMTTKHDGYRCCKKISFLKLLGEKNYNNTMNTCNEQYKKNYMSIIFRLIFCIRFTRLLTAVLSSNKLDGGFNMSSAADSTWSTRAYGSHVVDAVFDDS
jgi:hypothetical protein